jgi:serpin B
MRVRLLASIFPLAIAGAGCNPPPSAASTEATPPSATTRPPIVFATTRALAPVKPAPHVDAPADADVAVFARSSNALGLDLYAKARAQPGNVAISPISIAAALTMTWGGARGETAAQMKKVLHAEGESGPAMDVAGKLLGSLGNDGSKVTLRVANRLFGEKTYAFDAAYLDHTKAAFGAPLEGLDFKGAFESSRGHINDWVAGQTQDRVKELLPAGALGAETTLVLTSAIYFLGAWASPFAVTATRPAPFHASAKATSDVPTMSQTEHFRAAATDGVKVLEMPYEGGEVAMTFVLPDAVDGLDAVEKRLSTATIDGWTRALKPDRVTVSLPKLEIDPAASLSLGGALQELGMPVAFDKNQADFSGMITPKSPADRLWISKVFHKAFVKLDEKGTEAAAASAVVMNGPGGVAPSAPPSEFKADHPFLFLLRHVKSGAVLFMGRVSDPSKK